MLCGTCGHGWYEHEDDEDGDGPHKGTCTIAECECGWFVLRAEEEKRSNL